MDGLNVLLTKMEVGTDKALTVLGVFVGPGRLEVELAEVCSLLSALEVDLHEFDLFSQAVNDPMKVPMPLEVSGDTPLCHFISFFI